MPHWKPPPQLVHAILPTTGVGVGVGVTVGPLREHALMARTEAISNAVNRGLTKRVYRADELRLGRARQLVRKMERAIRVGRRKGQVIRAVAEHQHV